MAGHTNTIGLTLALSVTCLYLILRKSTSEFINEFRLAYSVAIVGTGIEEPN
jgi:hypothetical protein